MHGVHPIDQKRGETARREYYVYEEKKKKKGKGKEKRSMHHAGWSPDGPISICLWRFGAEE